MRKLRLWGRLAANALCAICTTLPLQARAADLGIMGKKLLLKSTPQFVLLSKDPGISITGSDPVGGSDSSITFDDGANKATLTLPSSNWSTNGSGSLFKYKNTSAPGGPSAVKTAIVKPGLLKVVVRSQCVRKSLVVHHRKRNTVGQRPVLVHAARVERATRVKKIATRAHHC